MYGRIKTSLLMAVAVLISLSMLGCYTMLRAPRAPSESPPTPKLADEWLEGDEEQAGYEITRWENRRERAIEGDPLAPRVMRTYRRSDLWSPGTYSYYDDPWYSGGYGYPIFSASYGDPRGLYTDPATGYPVPRGYKLVPLEDEEKAGSQKDQGTAEDIEKIKVPEGYKLVRIEDGYAFVPDPNSRANSGSEERIARRKVGVRNLGQNVSPRPVGRSSGQYRPYPRTGVRQQVGAPKPISGSGGTGRATRTQKRHRRTLVR